VNILMIINGAAYGQDATYNAVRLAASTAKREASPHRSSSWATASP
jgi:sulfur relay (sulfurtransferase) complex TusBCD TusD component (DsrE family)